MTCSDCASEAIRAEILQRRVDALLADLTEAEAEISGLRADNARLREQAFALAAQVSRTP